MVARMDDNDLPMKIMAEVLHGFRRADRTRCLPLFAPNFAVGEMNFLRGLNVIKVEVTRIDAVVM